MRLVLLLAVLAAAPAWAQTTDGTDADDRAAWHPTAQGVRLLGGYAAASAFVNNTTYADLSPEIGRFVRDGLALSLRVGLSGWRSSYAEFGVTDGVLTESDGRATSVGLSIGPAMTKYFGEAGATVYPYVGASALGFVRRSKAGPVGGERISYHDRGLSGSARAGLMVPVARNVSIEAQVVGSVYDLSAGVRGSMGFSAGISTFLY